MADIKINDLAAYTDPVSTDVLPIVDVGNDLTKKVSIADLLENAGTGTVTAPSFSFDGDNNTGIYQPGADQIAITTGGTQRLLISSDGTAEFAGLLKAGTIRPLNADSAAAPGLAVYDDPDTGFFRASSNNIGITTAGVERVRINSTGLLVGGTLPSAPNIELNNDGSATFAGSVLIDEGATAGQQAGSIVLGQVLGQPLATISSTRVDGSYKGELELKTSQNNVNSLTTALTLTSTQQALFPGSVLVGGTLPSSPNIELNNDGSATFAGDILSDTNVYVGDYDLTSTTSSGARLQGGILKIQRSSSIADSASVLEVHKGTQQVAGILADGSAEFKGQILQDNNNNTTGGGLWVRKVTDNSNVLYATTGIGAVKALVKGDGSAEFAGSVSIGGTAAANTIDEYEEGTFSPDFSIGGTNVGLTGSNALGTYTRIGNLCHVTAITKVSAGDVTGLTGGLAITGLPFSAPNSNASNYTTAAIAIDGFVTDYRNGNKTIYASISANGSNLGLASGARSSGILTEQDLDFNYGTCNVYATITYRIA
jgi:hypothetical protein